VHHMYMHDCQVTDQEVPYSLVRLQIPSILIGLHISFLVGQN